MRHQSPVPARSLRIILFSMIAAISAAGATAQQFWPDDFPERHLDTGLPKEQRERLDDMVGHTLPPILDHLRWMIASPFSLESARGKVVLLQFWSIGSPSSRSWWQRAAVLQNQFGHDDLAVVAIHTNYRPSTGFDYIERNTVPVATALDERGAVSKLFRVSNRPLSVLLDRRGVVRYGGFRSAGLEAAIQLLIDEPLDEDAPPPTVFAADGLNFSTPVEYPSFINPVHDARDVRGQQGPPIVAQEWLTDPPRTDGKFVLIDYWATWCRPCTRTIPRLNEYAERFRDDLVVVGISQEPAPLVRSFMNENVMNYTVGVDPIRRSAANIELRTPPHALVMSPDGVVRWQGTPRSLTEEIITQIIEAGRSERQ